MTDVVTKNLTQTADRIVTREVRGEETELIRVPISSTRQDRDGDEFDPDALSGMQSQIRAEQPLVFQNHGFTDFHSPLYDQRETIGTQVDAEIDDAKDADGDQQLDALVLPDLTHPEGERMLEQVKSGQAVKFSVGFRVKEAEPLNPEAENDERQRFIDVDLMETSKVGIPSNPDATASVAAKSAALTEQLAASGVDIDDEVAFAKALAAELVSRDEPPSREDVLGMDGLKSGVEPTDTRGPCDDNGDCPDGEVCVDGECVDEDSVTEQFNMDDEAEARFAALEERLADLTETIENAFDDEGEPADDDTPEETNGLTDEERDQFEALQAKVEEAEAGESETKNPDPDDVADAEESDEADTKGHQTPEEYAYGDD